MRLVTFDDGRGPRAGVLRGERLVDLGGPGVRELLEADRVGEAANAAGEELPLDAVRLLPPVPDPQKIVCIGLNYRAHAEEAGQEAPAAPTFFGKYANALAAPGEQVTLPASSRKVDFEAEVAFVVGRRAAGVPEAAALDHIAGYTLLNDLSARDRQFATPQWIPGKVFDLSLIHI